MPSLRRYIQVTPHTTLQAQIFLEDPSLLHTWLIHPTRPALPRIIDSLKDLLLPKLQEERERELTGSGSSKKNKAVKDVVIGSDFQVSVFFKDGASRHVVLMKRREFLGPKTEGGLRSNSNKMFLGNDGMGNVGEEVQQDEDGSNLGNLRIENEDEDVDLGALPLADPSTLEGGAGDVVEIEKPASFTSSVPSSRSRRRTRGAAGGRSLGRTAAEHRIGSDKGDNQEHAANNDDDDTYQQSGDEDEAEYHATRRGPRPKAKGRGTAKQSKNNRGKRQQPITVESGSDSETQIEGGAKATTKDEKKPLFRTSYDAFNIYGKTLYLIIRRLDVSPTGQGDAATMSEEIPKAVVSRDIPIGPEAVESMGTAGDVMEGWMYMSQAIREEPE